MKATCGITYSSALENISEVSTPSAFATRSKFSAVTLRSPRSILPMCERSIPALCANASCDTLRALRTSRIAWPNALRRRSSSSVRGLLDTCAPSAQVHQQATVFMTHFIIEVRCFITHYCLHRSPTGFETVHKSTEVSLSLARMLWRREGKRGRHIYFHWRKI